MTSPSAEAEGVVFTDDRLRNARSAVELQAAMTRQFLSKPTLAILLALIDAELERRASPARSSSRDDADEQDDTIPLDTLLGLARNILHKQQRYALANSVSKARQRLNAPSSSREALLERATVLADSLDENVHVLCRGDDATCDMLTSAASTLRALAAGRVAIPLGTITDAMVHKMCHYLRAERLDGVSGAACAKCAATVNTAYGEGEPGCFGIAFETLQMARSLMHDGATPPVASPWQPIATAPRDGTDILLGWSTGEGTRYAHYLDNSGTKAPWNGWKAPSMESSLPANPPTHWQPLPPPPAAEPTTAKEAG